MPARRLARRTSLRALLAGGVLLTLAGCGFHLRGVGQALTLGAASIAIDGAEPQLLNAVREQLRYYPDVALADAPAKAAVQLIVHSTASDKQTLSLRSDGRVAEYRLNYRLQFGLRRDGQDLLQGAQLTTRRDFAWDDNNPLAMEQQEQRLLAELRQDAASQLLRRIAARLRQATAPAAP